MLSDTCTANIADIHTVPKGDIGDRMARLSARKMKDGPAADSFAIDFNDD